MFWRGIAVLTVIPVLICSPALASQPAPADERAVTLVYSFFIDSQTAEQGITVSSGDGGLRIGFFPKVLAGETKVVINQFDKSKFEFPENWQPLSDVYSYEIENKGALNGKILIAVSAEASTDELKKIFIFSDGKWAERDSLTVNGQMARLGLSEK